MVTHPQETQETTMASPAGAAAALAQQHAYGIERPESRALYNKMRNQLFFFAGPCAIESEEHALMMAEKLAEIRDRRGVNIIYKSSFDKANRSKAGSFRGVGLEEAMRIFKLIKEKYGFQVITDIHEAHQAALVADVVDVIQIPAFLCRQTDLVVAAARTGRVLNIKKGQWLSPQNLTVCATKAFDAGNKMVVLCDRGTQFGNNDLIVDVRNLVWFRDQGCLSIQDCTHATQFIKPDGQSTSARREFAATYARAAVAVGVHGLFLEVHNDPANALSDAPCVWPLDKFEQLIVELQNIRNATRGLTDPFLGVEPTCVA